MTNIESLIRGSKKVTGIFGYWPVFHDAEVLELELWRGQVDPEKQIYILPKLVLKVHVWQMTKNVDSRGYLICNNNTIVKLRFDDIKDLEMNGFNHQNAIMDLVIEMVEHPPKPSCLEVKIIPAFGLGASFKCLGIEVVEADRCNDVWPLHPDVYRSIR
jgi:Immunity protein 50